MCEGLAGGVGLSRVKHQPLQVNPQSNNLVKNEPKRLQLSSNLLRKGLITKDRYEELIKYDDSG
jgi:hypothetical protein